MFLETLLDLFVFNEEAQLMRCEKISETLSEDGSDCTRLSGGTDSTSPFCRHPAQIIYSHKNSPEKEPCSSRRAGGVGLTLGLAVLVTLRSARGLCLQ